MDAVVEVSEIDLLKERADLMGISYHPSIGLDKLKEKLADKLTKEAAVSAEPGVESLVQRDTRLNEEANKLIRVRLTCMNPAKKSWPGEIISVRNHVIGTIKKFIPFNADEGYHIPQAILNVLKDRHFQQFSTVSVDGKKIKRGKLVKEFSIEELAPLTIKELTDLSIKQALNHSIED